MGAWYLSLAISLFLILFGMTIHWSIVLVGLLMLFVPVISMLVDHRRKRLGGDGSGAEEIAKVSADRADEREADGNS